MTGTKKNASSHDVAIQQISCVIICTVLGYFFFYIIYAVGGPYLNHNILATAPFSDLGL